MEFESRLKVNFGLGCASTSHSSVTSSPREAIVIRDAEIFGRPKDEIIINKIILRVIIRIYLRPITIRFVACEG